MPKVLNYANLKKPCERVEAASHPASLTNDVVARIGWGRRVIAKCVGVLLDRSVLKY
jgi:hypothetical protein